MFRQVVADLIRGGAAVVCTTSRPESVDTGLRAPDLLSLEISVPLPDAKLRRDQLGVLTRGMPLADDVQLDDVAARTPGFVAADLAALVREAGVRAALRQKSDESPAVAGNDFAAALEVVRPTSMADSTLELSDADAGRRRRHGGGEGGADRVGAVAADLSGHVRPARRHRRRAACCSTARPAAARPTW